MVTIARHHRRPAAGGKKLTLVNAMRHVIALALLMMLTMIGSAASAHVAGHPEWDEWFAAQRVPDGTGAVCCDKTDVYLLEDNDVRIVDEQYEARVEGIWLRFENTGQGKPGNKVFGYTGNPTGGYVAWVFHGLPRCFAEGTGT